MDIKYTEGNNSELVPCPATLAILMDNRFYLDLGSAETLMQYFGYDLDVNYETKQVFIKELS